MREPPPATPIADRQRAGAVVIGASAGALEALSELLPSLPSTYPLPIFLVVHLPPDKKSVMAECLDAKCQIQVHEVIDKEEIRSGHLYIAPPDYHLLVEADSRLSLSSEAPVFYSRPSIDVLFESAADVYGSSLIGIILSGANQDGSRGLKAIVDGGGTALVQSPDRAYAREMPQAAITACPSARVMTVPEIAAYLRETVSQG